MFLKEIYSSIMRNNIMQVLLTSLKAMCKKEKEILYILIKQKIAQQFVKVFLVYYFLRKKAPISRRFLNSVINVVQFKNCLMGTVFDEYSFKVYGYFPRPFRDSSC